MVVASAKEWINCTELFLKKIDEQVKSLWVRNMSQDAK